MNTNLRKIAEICNTSTCFRGKIIYDESLAPYTTFKVGGPAEIYAEPEDEKSCLFLLDLLHEKGLPAFILGGGSNLVVSDRGIGGCTVSTRSLKGINFDGDVLRCAAGTGFDEVTDFCIAQGLSGLENFAGLPGTVGGAVYMNARCYEKSINDVLVCAGYAALCGKNGEGSSSYGMLCYEMKQEDWEYKKSPFMSVPPCGSSALIFSACFKVEKGEPLLIEQRCRGFICDRKQKGHFRYPCAGSVFKNNRDFGKPSGKLIDEAGLCGMRIGDAQIAPWHGNFIVNVGHASADSIKELVKRIQSEVKKNTGFDLECEIVFCGK